jgi:hypothetical protein
MASVPVNTAETVEQLVARLLARWREDTAYLSSATSITAHPAYLDLVELGAAALPFLFRDLEKTGDGHLSKALTAITGAHPISAEERGHVPKIAETWLRWARENGHQWSNAILLIDGMYESAPEFDRVGRNPMTGETMVIKARKPRRRTDDAPEILRGAMKP